MNLNHPNDGAYEEMIAHDATRQQQHLRALRAAERAREEARSRHLRSEAAVQAALAEDPLLQEFVAVFTPGGNGGARGCPLHEIGPLAATLYGPLAKGRTPAKPGTADAGELAPRLLVNMALGDLARDQDCTTRLCTGTHEDGAVEGIRVWDRPGDGPQGREIILQASRLLHGGNVQDGLSLLALSFPALRFALTFRFEDPRKLFGPVFAQGGGEGQEAALALDLARRFWLLAVPPSGPGGV